jgi:tellurite resistance protein TerC
MDLELPAALEVGSVAVLLLIVVADLALAYRRPRVPSLRESGLWLAFYAVLALAFAGVLLLAGGVEAAGQFLTGWVAEYSLSLDNLFVIVFVTASLAVPRLLQQRLLIAGVVLALLFRGVLIVVGAALVERFSVVLYLFGLFLVYTAVNQVLTSRSDEETSENRVISFLSRRIRSTEQFDGAKLRTSVDGGRVLTPVLIVVIAIGTTDLVFALDSIPAAFGITRNPYLVFAATVLALMGLRQLYFLLGGLIERLVHLRYGIAVILAFIGVKLFFHALHRNELPFVNGGQNVSWAPEISTAASLAVILASMAAATAASLIQLRLDARTPTKGARHR